MSYVQVTPSSRFNYAGGRFYWTTLTSQGKYRRTHYPHVSSHARPADRIFEVVSTHERIPGVTNKDLASMRSMVEMQLEDISQRHGVIDASLPAMVELMENKAGWLFREDRMSCFDEGALSELFPRMSLEQYRPIVLSLILSRPFLWDAQLYYSIVSDGFYQMTNIPCAWDVVESADMKEGIYVACGTYSTQLRAVLKERLEDVSSINDLSLLKFCQGMSPESITTLVEGGYLSKPYPLLDYRGMSMVDENTPYLPQWFLSARDARRVNWLGDLHTLAETLRLHKELPSDDGIDFTSKDILDIHQQVVAAYFSCVAVDVPECRRKMSPYVEGGDVISGMTDGGYVVELVPDSVKLYEIGQLLNLCVGIGDTYSDRLSSGSSMFFTARTHGDTRPTILCEINSLTEDIVEIKARDNSTVDDAVVGDIYTAISKISPWEKAVDLLTPRDSTSGAPSSLISCAE